ncbi:hypothetical protein LAWI1_G008457 [Lachnellula willkommii]|uniref:Uncharacterized protein n=1 Tax=Lachnellula willkommii TaxID=215461 RepID=A0A559LY73_9HELO|nr:hypothetical protein LAWI1_G008457 [Lachnellula willkommii]
MLARGTLRTPRHSLPSWNSFLDRSPALSKTTKSLCLGHELSLLPMQDTHTLALPPHGPIKPSTFPRQSESSYSAPLTLYIFQVAHSRNMPNIPPPLEISSLTRIP